ncbi:MAG: flagellar protein FlaG [Bdellovibrionia bacterium]
MNIKSVGNPLQPFEIRNVDKNKRTEASSDRDPTQDQSRGGDTPERNLSEEELQAAVEHLKQIPGIKDNNLTVRLARENGVPVVFIEDPLGKVVRRIPESELATLSKTPKSKGNILDKAS